MKIVWLSSRMLGGDLSSTTQIQLANGLVKKGHSVDLYSPGKSVGNSFEHHSITRSNIRGLQARSVVKQLRKRTLEFKDALVIRSRDNKSLDACDIVVVVGRNYDNSKLRFDHQSQASFLLFNQ